ncbi:ATP-binding cassette glutathione S-conjugate transporter ycf1 [Coemansia sp. RSA 1365]|nr:ATP-binding cassette glutathione S-conjugate transporter ycf1 [Coemansia sp. RSA 1365]
MNNVLFIQERQLIRLGRIRDLLLEDVWQLPDRHRLSVNRGEFRYNVDEPLFLMRAILRMIWRPLLPIYAIILLLRIADAFKIVTSSYVLHCLDAPSDHKWYQGYCAAFCLLLLSLSKMQQSRVEGYARIEIARAIRALNLEIFCLPLKSKGGSTLRRSGIFDVDDRWLVIIPAAISFGITLTSWGIEWLTGSRHEWRNNWNYPISDSSISKIYREIKAIKLFGWERMYLDPELLAYYAKTKEIPWYAPVIRAIWSAIDIVEMLANQLSFYLIVYIYTGNNSPGLAVFTNSDLFQLSLYISNGRWKLEEVCSQLRVIRSVVDRIITIERNLKPQASNTLPRSEVTSLLPGPAVTMSACTFTWYNKAPNPVLKDISFSFLSGELVAVVGKTGSGKTSLLLAICGELEMIEGSGGVTGTIGYLEQSPWIMNNTLRANILFGRKYDSQYFAKVIHACALTEDIAQWPDGDMAVIGDRGVNISGGQRARLALARTLYSRADIYILDDPLSAVDSHVKRHILDHVILDTGVLAGKLRIVTTHSTHMLPFAHQVVSLDNRTATVTLQIPQMYHQLISPPLSSSGSVANKDCSRSLPADILRGKRQFQTINTPPVRDSELKKTKAKVQGATLWDNAKYVFQICGFPVIAVALLSSLAQPITWFVMDGLELRALRKNEVGSRFSREAALSYIRLLMVRNTLAKLIVYAESFIKRTISFKYIESNARRLFVMHLIYAPMSFFDSNTRQYVTQAYRNGLQTLSYEIVEFMMRELANLARIALSIYRVGCSMPQLLLLVPLIAWATRRRDTLIDSVKETLKRISRNQSVAHSRVADIIADGKRMIRLFGVEPHFTKLYIDDGDENYRLKQPIEALSDLSLNVREAIHYVGDMLITCLILFQSRYTRFRISSGEYITYQRLLDSLVYGTSQFAHLPSKVCSFADEIDVYRRFTSLQPEAPYIVENNRPPLDWPSHGRIEFCNFSMRYRDDMPLALKNINLTINPGEKIGIVGRTGAGKSTLAKALFRLVHTDVSGSILIDGLDIASIGVDDLRPRLGIIPQESTMFRGSYKKNLDPLREFTIEDIWAALLQCGVASKISPPRVGKAESGDIYRPEIEQYEEEKAEAEKRWANAGPMMRLFLMAFTTWPRKPRRGKMLKPEYGLEKMAVSDGRGFSNGQQQLFSLCRLLLRKRRIIVLDEATADVDLDTDKDMHRLIRKELSDCTILTIAHRLETVMKSDRIVVMDKGRIAEIGPPQELLKNGGYFAELVRTTNFGV